MNVQARPEISAIWMCFEGERPSREALDRYLNVLFELPYSFELTVVSSGTHCRDNFELTELLQARHVRATWVQLHGSYDESTAISAGLDASSAEIVVLLPPYLQSDPAEIHKMLQEVEQGADYVATWRTPRVDSTWGSGTSHLFNSMVR